MTNNNQEKIFLTQEGLEKVKKEYEELTTTRRKEIAQRIQEARELGDLTENAEYKAAREEQASVEGRIAELEELIKKAEVVKNNKKRPNKVDVGCKVRVHLEGEDTEFQIVGAPEADPSSGKISHESPLGQALLGKKVGEKIEVEAPVGKIIYKILDILF
jgi:transcription elongation factor GreA